VIRAMECGGGATLLTRSADLSLEFLMGRALDNAILNVGLKDVAAGMGFYSLMLASTS
jgi:hypothetical protein